MNFYLFYFFLCSSHEVPVPGTDKEHASCEMLVVVGDKFRHHFSRLEAMHTKNNLEGKKRGNEFTIVLNALC